jgi:heme/copper-type cytochrome/quinol oxidase subunit 2
MSGGNPAGPPPKEVQASFWLWIAGAVLSVISALLVLTERDTVVDQVRATPDGASLSQEQVDSLVLVTLLIAVVVSLVVAALYVLFAFKARAGRNWARIVLALLTAVSLLFQLTSVSILGLLVALIGVVATVLLFLPASNQYFTAAQRRG